MMTTRRSIASVLLVALLASLTPLHHGVAFAQGVSATANSALTTARQAYDSARYDDAIRRLTNALTAGELKGSEALEGRSFLARAYVRVGRTEQARSEFAAVLAADPAWRSDFSWRPDEVALLEEIRKSISIPTPPLPPDSTKISFNPPPIPEVKGSRSILSRPLFWLGLAVVGGSAYLLLKPEGPPPPPPGGPPSFPDPPSAKVPQPSLGQSR